MSICYIIGASAFVSYQEAATKLEKRATELDENTRIQRSTSTRHEYL